VNSGKEGEQRKALCHALLLPSMLMPVMLLLLLLLLLLMLAFAPDNSVVQANSP
jgi:hypothetical protein